MGLESRSGQGFSEPAVATVITASGIVTVLAFVDASFDHSVATVITASGIVTVLIYLGIIFILVATVITASGIVTWLIS